MENNKENRRHKNSETGNSPESSKSSNHHKFRIDANLKEKLNDFPDVLQFIESLEKYIQKQHKKIHKLKAKLKKKKNSKDVGTQYEAPSQEPQSIAEEIKQAAEAAVQNTGFVYEATSGLYYDYTTGYYYDAELGLYYDGNTGTYLKYNTETEEYEFHSQLHSHKNKTAERKRKQSNPDNAKVITCCPMENLMRSFDRMNINYLRRNAMENAKPWPPCMRIIVEESSIPSIKLGTLYIITYEGGTIGREGEHAVTIPDINVSKHHLRFSFDKTADYYTVTDLGSRNGTLLNGKRISPSKQESEPQEISHASRIQIGTTTLLCHVHVGNETCGFCEPGLIQTVDKKETISLSKTELHKHELKQLRKKFGINQYQTSSASLPPRYKDRAQVRRETIGSQNPYEKTEAASYDQSIASNNVGYKLLSKMGWSEGQALGKDGSGTLEPVQVSQNEGKKGVGCSTPSTLSVSSKTEQKKNILKKTQQRYEESSIIETDPEFVNI